MRVKLSSQKYRLWDPLIGPSIDIHRNISFSYQDQVAQNETNNSWKSKRIVDTSIKESSIDPKEVARRLGGEVVEPKGKMLDSSVTYLVATCIKKKMDEVE